MTESKNSTRITTATQNTTQQNRIYHSQENLIDLLITVLVMQGKRLPQLPHIYRPRIILIKRRKDKPQIRSLLGRKPMRNHHQPQTMQPRIRRKVLDGGAYLRIQEFLGHDVIHHGESRSAKHVGGVTSMELGMFGFDGRGGFGSREPGVAEGVVGRGAGGGVAYEERGDEVFGAAGYTGPAFAGEVVGPSHDSFGDFFHILSTKRNLRRQKHVRHDAQTPNIRFIGIMSFEDFGTHGVDCPHKVRHDGVIESMGIIFGSASIGVFFG